MKRWTHHRNPFRAKHGAINDHSSNHLAAMMRAVLLGDGRPDDLTIQARRRRKGRLTPRNSFHSLFAVRDALFTE
jgi:hypothetical protein